MTDTIATRPAEPRPHAELRTHYTGLLTCTIARLLNVEAPPAAFEGADARQHQQNGAYGAHQLAVYMLSPDGKPGQLYRVIIAPADAPISIGCIPADQHFAEPLTRRDSSGVTEQGE